MKSLKTSGLATAGIAVLLAFAVTEVASATVLTSPSGTFLPAGTKIHAQSEGSISMPVDLPPSELSCESTFSGKTSNTGSSTETVRLSLESLSFTKCSNKTFFALSPGTMEFHTSGSVVDGSGLLTWSGAEWTTEFSGFHCIYRTSNTTLGTVTGSNTGGAATLDAEATIP